MNIFELLYKKINNYQNKKSLANKFRKRRIKPLLDMIEYYYNTYGFVKIIDIGGTYFYWDALLDREFIEKKKIEITIINIRIYNEDIKHDEHFSRIVCDGCDLSIFKDKSFHISHSNSVIGHVGEWNRVLKFTSELKRVSNSYFVQTPNFWFFLDPFTLIPFCHWLPELVKLKLLKHLNLGPLKKNISIEKKINAIQSIHYFDKYTFKYLFPESTIIKEKIFIFTKSLIALKL